VAQDLAANKLTISEPEVYRGMCAASAAVALDQHHFAVVSDEDSKVRVYANTGGGAPVKTFDFSQFLLVDSRFPEVDLEGAARIGNIAYWISSHGLNQAGKIRPSRYRFFATKIETNSTPPALSTAGKPYRDFVADFARDPRLKQLGLPSAASRPPKARDGMNIEGLCATPDGKLLIGFRNPIPGGKTLLVPVENPSEVTAGRPPRFGEPILLAMDGLGVRDMAFCAGEYLIIGSSFDGAGHSKLFRWSGGAAAPQRVDVKRLKDYNPEAIIVYTSADPARVQILSDDDKRKQKGRECQDLADPMDRTFRGFWLEL
jgi:hypothetical protein